MHVSVVLPTHNRAYCIERAIRSVQAQTWSDWELVIVDDDSSDQTEQICQKLKVEIGSRLIYLKVARGGASNARNTGIYCSSGAYVAFLDSDDYFYPEKLAVQIGMMRRFEDVDFSFSNWSTFYDGGEPGVSQNAMPSTFSGNVYPSLLAVARNCIVTPSILIRREALFRAGFFDTSMSVCEDIDLWRRVSRKGKALKIDTPMVGVHLRRSNVFPYEANLRGRLRLYEKAWIEDPGLPRSFFVFLFDEIFRAYLNVAEHYGHAGEALVLRRAVEAVEQGAAAHTFRTLEEITHDTIRKVESIGGPKVREAA